MSEAESNRAAGEPPHSPPTRAIAGAAEQAIWAEHRALAVELAALAGGPRPGYETSSGFRFVYDAAAPRDVADSSALAHQLDAAVQSMVEDQPLRPPPGQELDVEVAAARAAVAGEAEEGGPPEGVLVTVTLPKLQTLLEVPAAVTARERTAQACRALAHGWYDEAEDLFVAATELSPTDPLVWFGAGLAASRTDPSRAADHLVRASRYLTSDDPPGAAYVAILAACLKESIGDARAARRILRTRLDELDDPCPAISLHLARLGPDRRTRAAEAISLDATLDADRLALGLDVPDDVVQARKSRTEEEIDRLAASIAELRWVGGESATPGDAVPAPALSHEGLSLLQVETQLWSTIAICEEEIARARELVAQRELDRLDSETDLATLASLAEQDLVRPTVASFFALCLTIAAAVFATYLVARSVLSAVPPAFVVPVGVVWWTVELGLGALAVWAFFRVYSPHHGSRLAQTAEDWLPTYELVRTERRADEFLVRRRFRKATRSAELRIGRIVDSRRFVVPRRPTFVSAEGPVEGTA